MPGTCVDEEDAPPKKKSGSARTSKKSKRRNVIRYEDWSAEQESVNSSPTGAQKQAQDADDGALASLGSTEEATAPVAPEITPEASMDTSPDICDQQQAQDADNGAPASLESTEEATAPVAPETPVATETTPEASMDTSPDICETASGFLSPYDDQDVDAPPPDVHSPTTSEHTEETHELQRGQDEQSADESPSENMRPTAQNLRYGGYPAQPAPQNRNTPLGSGRLQNTSKLGAIAFPKSRIV